MGRAGGPAQAVGQGAQHGHKLGRVEDLEIEALERDVEGELVERVGPGMQHAAVLVHGLQPPGGRRGTPVQSRRDWSSDSRRSRRAEVSSTTSIMAAIGARG